MIQAKDCRLVRASCDDVYRALVDFGGYVEWWPASMKLQVLAARADGMGSRARVRTAGGVFECEVVSAVPEREVTLRYSGVHEGTGTWTITPEGDGAYVCYELDVKVRGRLARLVGRVLNFRRRQSRVMREVFDALERHLARTRRGGTLAGV